MTVLLTELKGSTLVLTMNRPEALNALSNELTAALLQEVRAASARREVRSILIRSTGGDAFAGNETGAHCAGSSAKVVLAPSTRGSAKPT